MLDSTQVSVIMWVVLPLYADPVKKVRLVFIQFLRNIPFLHDSIAKLVSKSFEDDLQKPAMYNDYYLLIFRKLEDIPQTDEISISHKEMADITYELIELVSSEKLDVLVKLFS
jgi:hypothetical protein